MAISSQTTAGALQGLVQRQNQAVLDGTIVAVLDSGELIVSVQEQHALAPTVLDHLFAVGEPVILARSDEDEWVIIGVGSTGTIAPTGVSPTTAPTTIVSQSLHEAVLRLVNKRNQILRKGLVLGQLADGTLVIRLGIGDRLATRSSTTQVFEIGQTVYTIQQDDGEWLALGSR